MPPRRQRAMAVGNISFNGVSLKGQVISILGDCMFGGHLKTKAGKKPIKKSMSEVRIRFEDKNWIKQNDLKNFYETHISKSSLEKFFEIIAD